MNHTFIAQELDMLSPMQQLPLTLFSEHMHALVYQLLPVEYQLTMHLIASNHAKSSFVS